jgi:predicted NBD/HSP70 family sugar kinase
MDRRAVSSPTDRKVSLLYAADGESTTSADGNGFATGQPSLLRAINERTVLELIRTGLATSRAEIARTSGLSKPTVSQALASLADAGLVHEVGRATGGKGPSAVLYELNPRAGCVVGIDVGRNWVRAAAADIAGSITARLDRRAARSAAGLIEQIGQIAHDVAGEAGMRWRQVTHATVGAAGVVDPRRGAVAMAPNLPGFGRPGLVGAIRDELGTVVSFENDVNLAALGELTDGAGRGVSTFAYLWVGTGVGLGVVIDGRLYRGATGAAGEVGYLPLGPGDPHDRAVRLHGQLEEAMGAAAVVRSARALGMRPPLSPKRIFAAAREGDRTALAVVEQEARRIALAIAAIAPVLDPELVVLGGGIAAGGDLPLEPIIAELETISPFRPRLAIGELGDEAVLHGAVATALAAAQDQLFSRARHPNRKEIVV